jgi:hypothetical protein
MSFQDRIRSIIRNRPKPPEPMEYGEIEPETLARYFDNNQKHRIGPLSKLLGISPEQLTGMLTRQNGYTCGPAPMHWYSYCELLKEPCLDSVVEIVQYRWRELQHS